METLVQIKIQIKPSKSEILEATREKTHSSPETISAITKKDIIFTLTSYIAILKED